MTGASIAQLIAALVLTGAGLVILAQHRTHGRKVRLSGSLFLIAAAINWALFLIRL